MSKLEELKFNETEGGTVEQPVSLIPEESLSPEEQRAQRGKLGNMKKDAAERENKESEEARRLLESGTKPTEKVADSFSKPSREMEEYYLKIEKQKAGEVATEENNRRPLIDRIFGRNKVTAEDILVRKELKETEAQLNERVDTENGYLIFARAGESEDSKKIALDLIRELAKGDDTENVAGTTFSVAEAKKDNSILGQIVFLRMQGKEKR